MWRQGKPMLNQNEHWQLSSATLKTPEDERTLQIIPLSSSILTRSLNASCLQTKLAAYGVRISVNCTSGELGKSGDTVFFC